MAQKTIDHSSTGSGLAVTLVVPAISAIATSNSPRLIQLAIKINFWLPVVRDSAW